MTHEKDVKRIFKYLKDIVEFRLWYKKGGDFILRSYTDVVCAGSVDDWKSTSGATFFLGDRLVSYSSNKQDSIFVYTAEAKYIVEASCCTQVMWMRQTLKDITVKYDEGIPILCENSAINISKTPIMHSRTKHISIKYHYLREKVVEKEVRLDYISTKE